MIEDQSIQDKVSEGISWLSKGDWEGGEFFFIIITSIKNDHLYLASCFPVLLIRELFLT